MAMKEGNKAIPNKLFPVLHSGINIYLHAKAVHFHNSHYKIGSYSTCKKLYKSKNKLTFTFTLNYKIYVHY